MKKGIYKDTKTNTWYIKTKKRNKNITIRGYASKKEADEDYDFAIDKWFRSHHFDTNAKTPMFENVAFDYIEYVRNGRASKTVDRERTQMKTYWSIIFANDSIKNVFNFERLKLIYSNLKSDDKFNVRKKHDLVFTFLAFTNYCYIQKIIDKDTLEETEIIFRPINYTKTVQTSRRVAEKGEIEAFLNVIDKNSKDYFMFLMLVRCGLRISELLGLCGDAFENDKVIIKRQLLTTGKLTDKLKTGQSYRSVPLTKELQALAQKYVKNNKRVFETSHTNFRRTLFKYEKQAKIPQYVPHEFRHTRCFELAKKCENISDVVYCAKIMGHSVSIFENVYCSHLDKSLEDKFFD